jgi:hypothetical protein
MKREATADPSLRFGMTRVGRESTATITDDTGGMDDEFSGQMAESPPVFFGGVVRLLLCVFLSA